MEFNLAAESIQDRTARIQHVVEHFGSERIAKLYLSGRIDWYGNKLCDYCGSKCACSALDLW